MYRWFNRVRVSASLRRAPLPCKVRTWMGFYVRASHWVRGTSPLPSSFCPTRSTVSPGMRRARQSVVTPALALMATTTAVPVRKRRSSLMLRVFPPMSCPLAHPGDGNSKLNPGACWLLEDSWDLTELLKPQELVKTSLECNVKWWNRVYERTQRRNSVFHFAPISPSSTTDAFSTDRDGDHGPAASASLRHGLDPHQHGAVVELEKWLAFFSEVEHAIAQLWSNLPICVLSSRARLPCLWVRYGPDLRGCCLGLIIPVLPLLGCGRPCRCMNCV